jgi:hypothetical protein
VKFDAVVVDFVFLPETFFRAIGDVDWRGAHDVALLSWRRRLVWIRSKLERMRLTVHV